MTIYRCLTALLLYTETDIYNGARINHRRKLILAQHRPDVSLIVILFVTQTVVLQYIKSNHLPLFDSLLYGETGITTHGLTIDYRTDPIPAVRKVRCVYAILNPIGILLWSPEIHISGGKGGVRGNPSPLCVNNNTVKLYSVPVSGTHTEKR